MGRDGFWLRLSQRRIARPLLFLTLTVIACLCGGQSALADKPFPYVYVPESSGGVSDLAVVDTDSNSIITKIPLSAGVFPSVGAVTPDGRRIYLATSGDAALVIDASTNTITSSINVASSSGGFSAAAGVAVTPDGSKVYLTNADGALVDISTSTNNVTSTIPLGLASFQAGAGVATAPDGTKVYVALPSLHSVAVIDTNSDTVTSTISVDGEPAELAVSPDGTKLYVTSPGAVSVIATGSQTVIKTIPVPSSMFGGEAIAMTPDGTRVFIGNTINQFSPDTTGTTSIIATSIDTVIDTIFDGVGLIAITPDGAHAYVNGNNRLLMIDTATNLAVRSITGLSSPTGIFTGPFRSHFSSAGQ